MKPAELSGPSQLSRTWRYLPAVAGPVAVAGANFLLSFTMLRLEAPELFGTFVFLFAAALFTIALASALFGAPMQALNAAAGLGRPGMMATVASAAVVAALVAAPVFAMLGIGFGLGFGIAACYGIFAGLTALRALGRAWSYAIERPWSVALSDLAYATVTLGAFAAAVGPAHAAPIAAVYPALALGTAASIASLGPRFAALLRSISGAALRRYGAIWRTQSRWSLLGVVQAEATANAHIYLLTLLAGTAAVAPVAASALLVRPINVIQNALVEYERAQMARFLGSDAMQEVDRSMRLFRIVLLLVWGGTVALAAPILAFYPGLVFPESYDLATVRLAAVLWAGVSLVIVVQVPWNVLLQASGDFRTLARAGIGASVASVIGVLIAIALGATVWTVAALGLGWIASTVIVARAAHAFRSSRSPDRGLAGAGA